VTMVAPSPARHRWARLRASGLRREIAAHPIAWAYLFLALAFGLILVVLVPPFQTNDEPEHYFRSWAIAEGQLLVGQGAVVELPSNVAWLFADLKAIEVTQGKAKYDTSLTLSHLSDSVSAQRVAQATLTGTYSPIGYIPQALGIDLVRLFGGSPLMAMYVARVFMLVASVALVFWALRLTPFGAPVLALVALLPMSMTLCASLNPGALLDAGALLWIALVLRALKSPSVRTPLAVLLIVTAVALLTVKPGYATLALLILLVPRNRYQNQRQHWATIVACIAGAIGVTAALLATSPAVPLSVLQARGVAEGMDHVGQMRFMLAHPWAFTKVLMGSVGDNALAWIKEFVGAPGRGSVILSDLATLVALLGGLLLMMRSAARGVELAAWRRVGFVAVAGVSALAVVGALYVLNTPVASSMILSVQGRYFLPIAPCLFIGLYGLRLQRQRTLVVVFSTCVLLMAAMTIMALLRHFYAG